MSTITERPERAVCGPEMMTVRQTADALGLLPKAITRLRRDGKLTSVRTSRGARPCYFRAQVMALRDRKPLTPEQVTALLDQAGVTA